jgi:hypothetical protein
VRARRPHHCHPAFGWNRHVSAKALLHLVGARLD